MKAKLAVLALAVLMAGSTPSPVPRADIQRDLEVLASRGCSYRLIGNNLIELTEPLSGNKRLKYASCPSEVHVRSWAAQRGIPVLEIDPNTIDTSRYSGWYAYWTTIPLSNSIGIPLLVGDADHNGQADVYGIYKDTLSWDNYEARVYELDSLGGVLLRYVYVPRPGASREFADVDNDSSVEVVWSYYGLVTGYEQHTPDSLPLHPLFAHERFHHGTWSGSNAIFMGDLDRDSLTDFLYQGTGPDPNDTNIAVSKTYVAEYNPAQQTFNRVWSTEFVPGSGVTGFPVGDFDGNGTTDFVATHGSGKIFLAENTGPNQYALAWHDSTPFVNLYYLTSGDVDRDGRTEFFAGATMSDGNWVLTYESDSIDTYSPKFLFHLLSGGVLAEPVYATVDVDGDGKLELAVLVASDLYIFKSDKDNDYYLWYLKRENTADAISFYDFDRDRRQDLLISKFGVNSQGNGWLYADLYLARPLLTVNDERGAPPGLDLSINYPNPFNSGTTIQYSLRSNERVTVCIYNITGEGVVTLVDAIQARGSHSVVWNADGFSSGVYFCRLQVSGVSVTKKLLLVR